MTSRYQQSGTLVGTSSPRMLPTAIDPHPMANREQLESKMTRINKKDDRLSGPQRSNHNRGESTKSLLGGDVGFSHLRDAFALALRSHPDKVSESVYVLAGRLMRMRIVGRRLAESMNLAFAHLHVD